MERGRVEPGALHPEIARARRWAMLVCFVAAGAISIMSQLTMTTCLPAIIDEFGIDASRSQWLTTAYMLALGAMVPCTGYLASRFQSRHLFAVGNLVFLLGLAGAFAPDFATLVVVRCVQGCAAGLFIPLMQIVAFRLFGPGERGFAMGIAAVALAAGPVLGPIVAGVCTDVWGWRSVFVCVSVLTALSLASYPVVAPLRDDTSRDPFDAVSALLAAAGFAGLIVGASNLGSADAVAGVAAPCAAGVACLLLFGRRQFRSARPLLDLWPLRNADFLVGALAVMAVFGTLINVEVFMSIYIQNDQGQTAVAAAMCLLPGSLVSAAVAPFTGRVLDRRGPLALAATGFCLLTAAGAMAALVEASSPLWYSVAAFALRCAGNACVMQNLQTWAVNGLPGELVTHGTAIVNTMRQVGGAFINALLFALMGVVAATGGELAGIKVAFAVSTAVLAALGAAVVVHLARRARAD